MVHLMSSLKFSCCYLCLLLLLAACTSTVEAVLSKEPSPLATVPSSSSIPVTVEAIPLIKTERSCTRRFVEHQLDHTTTVPGGREVRMFEANGSGVAVNDLDNDGDLDIVLANHADPNTILWNKGALTFRTEHIGEGDSRAANIVDVDGDGWLDIIFTRRASAPELLA